MHDLSTWALYGSMLLAGLAGSLHCIGMCGPILFSFQQVFPKSPVRFDFAWYHAGRVWTYGLLGFLAGWAGQGLRASSAYLGWQRPLSVAIGLVVIFSGLALLGVIPGLRFLASPAMCDADRLRGPSWLLAMLRAPGRLPRLLLGATMGFLPCGLVYAMLAVAATLPSPLHAALGMVVFGLGTVPALTAVLLAGRILPPRVRVHGTRLAAIAVILAGCWMTVRALLPHSAHCMH